LSSILSLGRTFTPTIAKTLGISGLASEGASQLVKTITGGGQTGGSFVISLTPSWCIKNK